MVRNMGWCQFSKNSPPHWSVRVKTHVVDRLGLRLESGPPVLGQLVSGMRVSTSFQLRGRSLYIDWRTVVVVVVVGGKCPTPYTKAEGIIRRGNVRENMSEGECPGGECTTLEIYASGGGLHAAPTNAPYLSATLSKAVLGRKVRHKCC